MYKYTWDEKTGGILLTSEVAHFSKEPRPVYFRELDLLGFDKFWNYPKDDAAPLMWAEANNYFYRGRHVAMTKGGALYQSPELIILEEPEPNGGMLRPVDVPAMLRKNAKTMEILTQETIQKIYNTYKDYRKKVDLFYVAFSGGKDSVVVLDLVQRALPHDDFIVLFGNTDMEFPTTLDLVKEINEYCGKNNIKFLEAKAEMSAIQSWNIFGPPARKNRWCCTVHKTAPVINKLCEEYNLENIRTMMITGVRGDESSTRSDYDELSLGKKLAGQFSYHAILNWSSVEIFLYIWRENLPINEAYKYGFNRVGCIMCPNSAQKHEYMKRCFFPDEVKVFSDIIVKTSRKDLSGENAHEFLNSGGWKSRLSGRELRFNEEERFTFEEQKGQLFFSVVNLNSDWIEWYKTIGSMDFNGNEYSFEYNGVWRKGKVETVGEITTFQIENEIRTKNSIEFIYFFKAVLAKSQYCIRCKACVAECPYRNITMDSNGVKISEKCIKCRACLKILSGCLFYNSVRGSKGLKNFKGINRYLSIGVNANWIKNYLDDPSYEPGNRKTDVMFGFLDDAEITKKRKITLTGEKIIRLGLSNDFMWALMLCNLAYSVPFRWYIENIPFGGIYDFDRLTVDMEDASPKARAEFWNGFKVILDSNESFKRIGFGIPDITEKTDRNNVSKKTLNSITRSSWEHPDDRVILYGLYKFAEKCGDYYQFSLSSLLDDSIERGGVSPTRIFGLDRDGMIPILNGLSINYPEFISASFTLGLETVNLRPEKSSADVLDLF